MPILKSLNRANEVIEKISNDINPDKQCEGSTVLHGSLITQMKELCRRFDIFRASVLKDIRDFRTEFTDDLEKLKDINRINPEDYATKEDLKNIVIPEISLDEYSTTLENDAKYQPKGDYAKENHNHSEYLTEVPEEYITDEKLTAKGYKNENEIRAIIDDVIMDALNSEV